jgi:NO-binding membrane sensor protein with MHYT domain
MNRILSCISLEHSPWLIMFALLVCASASAGTFYVLDTMASTPVTHRRRWLFLAALLAGGGTWATHFTAMLGYHPGIPIDFDLGLTLSSALASIASAWAALEVFNRFSDDQGRVAAGLLLGAAMAATHLLGALGVEASATKIWAWELVMSACLFAGSFAIAAFEAFAAAPSRYRILAAATFLFLAIVSLHFIAMGALSLIPDPQISPPRNGIDRQLLAVIVASGAAGALFVGLVLALADRRITTMELARMGTHHLFTGAPDRRPLQGVSRRPSRDATQRLAIIAIDVDRFRRIDDPRGHAGSDEFDPELSPSFDVWFLTLPGKGD